MEIEGLLVEYNEIHTKFVMISMDLLREFHSYLRNPRVEESSFASRNQSKGGKGLSITG